MRREMLIQNGILATGENYRLISVPINAGNNARNITVYSTNTKKFTEHGNIKLIKNKFLNLFNVKVLLDLKQWKILRRN
jgi:hypothetical protein